MKQTQKKQTRKALATIFLWLGSCYTATAQDVAQSDQITQDQQIIQADSSTTGKFEPVTVNPSTTSDDSAKTKIHDAAAPTDEAIFRCHAFREPLVPIGQKTTAAENAALDCAITLYTKRTDPDDASAILDFLKEYPASAWRAALLLNLGLEYRQTGWFLKALAAFEEAWKLSRSATDRKGKALADGVIGELTELHARLGHRERVETLLAQIKDRTLVGSATEKVTLARESASLMREQPERTLKCGAFALARIHDLENPSESIDAKILDARATKRGMSLAQVRQLARELKMDYTAAKRQPGAKVIVPSVVNWKAEHYAAILKEHNGRFLIHDPALGSEIWVSAAALDAESSGYFLIPRSPSLPEGWQLADVSRAANVWGSGGTASHDPSGTTPNDDKAKDCPPSNGMAVYNFHLQTVSLNITDTPVGYDPPVGYPIRFTVTYNQRDAYQPQNFDYSNLGPKWTFNWLSYVQVTPSNQSADVTLYVAGGGAEFYTHFDSTSHRYAPGLQSGAVLRQVSWFPYPPRYERTLRDGSLEVFELDYSGNGTNKVFLTERIDSAGNSVHLHYDQYYRLLSITDALGQATTLSYEFTDMYKITKVTDPFGRFAMFGYNNFWKLISITDPVGIVSQFAYESYGSDFVNMLTTPYATTTFANLTPSPSPSPTPYGEPRIIQATDQATGEIERVEFRHDAPGVVAVDPNPPSILNFQYTNNYYNYRNSFYWNTKAMAQVSPSCRDNPSSCGASDYAMAQLYHWLHTADGQNAANIKERKKAPLENAVYYFYLGQPNSYSVGTSGFPMIVAQKLSGSDTRVSQFQWNALGNMTQEIDSVGRTSNYIYWTYNPADSGDPANMVDVKEIRQTRSGNELLFSATYDPNQHRRLTATDAAGKTNTYSYNSFGEVLTVENPRHEITTYAYGDGSTGLPIGYLASITGPALNGSSPVTSFTYDNANRVRTVRNDPDGYITTTDYDNLDRPTHITYPDATNQHFLYTDDQRGMTLDLTASKDRLGRWTYRHYNPTRQMDKFTDPNGHTTLYDWCSCGSLNTITDANTNVTHFNRDLQGRLYQKVFANSTTLNYLYEGQAAPNTVGATSRLKSVTDSLNQVTNYQYFTDDRVNQISYTNAIYPTPTVTFVYDPNYPRITLMTDGVGSTNYIYYPISSPPVLGSGRLQTVDGPLAIDTITYTYDELGRTIGRSINGSSSTISFDSLGRLSKSDNVLGHFDRVYDSLTQRLQRLTYPSGIRADYTYFDNLHDRRLQTLRNSTGNGATTLSQFDYTYDPEGQIQTLTKSLSGHGSNLLFQYDNSRQLTGVSIANQQFDFSYDNAANRYDVKTYTGAILRAENYYKVNNLNQLDTVSTNGAASVPLHYDGNGNLTDNAAGETYEWDAANRLTAINYTSTGHRTEFSYDGLGRRAKITEYGAGMTATIEPEGTDYTLFTSEPFTLPAGSYTFTVQGLNTATAGHSNIALVDDINLNGTSVANGGFETPTVQNYQVAPTGSNWSYTGISGIAANGSTLTSGNPPAPQGTEVAFVQNDGSLWQTANIAAGTYTLTFKVAQSSGNETYQRLRVNLRSSPAQGVKTFVWSGNTIAEEHNASGAIVTKRFFAEGEQRIVGAAAVNYYYTRDHLGSVREVTDATGALKGQYDYDAWGNSVVTNGNMHVDFGYTGHYFHQPSGLNLAMYRAYSPNLGRWISRDRIGEIGGINLYGYVRNNPLNLFDPTGLSPQSQANAIAVGATIGFILSLPVDAFEDFFSGGALAIANPATTAAMTGLGGVAGAALDDLISQMAGTKEGMLPSGGSCPYDPKKQKSKEPIRNKQGDYIDNKGNAWRWDPNKQEWDVQHPDGTHTNVSPTGEITHGPNNF